MHALEKLILPFTTHADEKTPAMQKAFQKAILKFGMLRRIFLDNGCSYRNSQLDWICAKLGIVKIQSKPYHPQGKAKCERSHRTEKDRWMNCTGWNSFHSLEDVNESCHRLLDTEYNNATHSSIGMTPRERYLKDFDSLKFVKKSVVEEIFLHRALIIECEQKCDTVGTQAIMDAANEIDLL